MSSEPIEAHDGVVHFFWCSMLGQAMHFGYCRRSQEGRPCARVLTYFQGRFDVQAFLEALYTHEHCARFLAPPYSRLERLAGGFGPGGPLSLASNGKDK
ncbi:conserved hypothetical protein [Desulfarculales bacterium]